jgi:hypothetical protein
MGKLILICPNCRHMVQALECENCDYSLSDDRLLESIVLQRYNRSLALLDSQSILQAWEEIREGMTIFPFLVTPLLYAFNLAIHVGEFGSAQIYLARLEPALQESVFLSMKRQLASHTEVFNRIVSSSEHEVLPPATLTFIQHYLLYLRGESNESLALHQKALIDSESTFTFLSKEPELMMRRIPFWGWIVMTLLLGGGVAGWGVFFDKSHMLQEAELALQETHTTSQVLADSVSTLSTQLERETSSVKSLSLSQNTLVSTLELYNTEDPGDFAETLLQQPELTIQLTEWGIYDPIEAVCTYLYGEKRYSDLVNLRYESYLTPHAKYYLIRSVKADSRSDYVHLLEKFVNQYPTLECYIAPFLREIIDYYMIENHGIAREYAIKLDQYLAAQPYLDRSFYLSNNINRIMQ